MNSDVFGAVTAAVAVIAAGLAARHCGHATRSGRVLRRLVAMDAPAPLARRSDASGVRLRWIRAQLELADDAGPLVARWAALSAAGVVLGTWRMGGAGALLATMAAIGVPVVVAAWRRGQVNRNFTTALPGVLEGVAGRLRAGASLAEAVAGAADETTGSRLLDEDLCRLQRRIAHGQPFVTAVRAWEEERGLAGTRLVAAALVLGAQAGGARARAVDGVAATLRERLALAGEVHALSTQARASALVMVGAPVAFAALGLLSDRAVSEFMLRTPAGLSCLVAGLLLDAAAGLWMLRIARNAA